jgi:ATP-dependent Lon protease
MVAFYLEMPAKEKQELLELFPVAERMRRVLVGVERDLIRLEAQEEIQQKVQEELGEKQREIVLREQLKAIQRSSARRTRRATSRSCASASRSWS